jgi:hypothetical protein
MEPMGSAWSANNGLQLKGGNEPNLIRWIATIDYGL